MTSSGPLEIFFVQVRGTYANWEMENSIHKVKETYAGKESVTSCDQQ